MATPNSVEGKRAAAVLRVSTALQGQPEPNREQRRAAAKKRRRPPTSGR